MNLLNVFKTGKDKQRDIRVKQRRAFREANSTIQQVEQRIESLQKDKNKRWEEAKQYLMGGQKAASNRCLQSCRMIEMLINKMETKKWVFTQLVSRAEIAKDEQSFIACMGDLNSVLNIDCNVAEMNLDSLTDKLSEQDSIDSLWEQEYKTELQGISNISDETIPQMEELEKQLEDEVCAGIDGGAIQDVPDISTDLSTTKQRLSALIEENK
ncbi:MAG: Snf7 family protein [Candidatus Omnitrophica bacterium]|nr:Snf7 family protein [Candidatus Omnitrophota bacterium]